MQEIDRIGETTEFNGKKVFQGQDAQTMPIRTASARIRSSMTCSYSMTAGSDAENFLKNTSQNGTLHTITANGYGIHIDNYDTISWADMNVIGDNISGKTIHFNDPKSGISFDITCNEKATLSMQLFI